MRHEGRPLTPDELADPSTVAALPLAERLRLAQLYSAAVIALTAAPPPAPSPAHEELLEAKDAAPLVRMSVEGLRRWDDCPFLVRRGRRKFYSRNGIDRWIAEQAG